MLSVDRASGVPKTDAPDLEALQRCFEFAIRALRAGAIFLWDADAPALRCGTVPIDDLEALSTFCATVLTTREPARHDGGSHAWTAVPVRLGGRRGALCVAAPAPRTFDHDDFTTIEALGALVETLSERPRLPLQALVDLSATMLREAPAMPAEALAATAESLEVVVARLRALAAPPVVRAAATPDGREAARILLADDLDLNRRLIADMLSLDGHRVDCVSDGAAAVRAVAAERYDLVLMDMVMPEMDGLAATRAIRALPRPARDVPIVALTANAMREQLDSCLEAGMDAALTKPMSLDALTEAVAHWTRGRHAAA